MNNIKTISVSCGDWHLGWGYGGHDKIGKLSFNPETNQFIWSGSSQGRHGQKWNAGAVLVMNKDLKVVSSKGGHPAWGEIMAAIDLLKKKIDKAEMEAIRKGVLAKKKLALLKAPPQLKLSI